jgi:hypothetical protein
LFVFVNLYALHAARVGTMRSGSIGASDVRLARRQSIPSSNIDSSALVNAIVPVAAVPQNLQAVAASAAEDEQVTGTRVGG